MSVQRSVSRPATRSTGAAVLGVLVTLTVFVGVFLAFLVAPLVLFAVAALAYAVLRPRAARRTGGSDAPDPPSDGAPAPGFGVGPR